jgi:hypothetical protein
MTETKALGRGGGAGDELFVEAGCTADARIGALGCENAGRAGIESDVVGLAEYVLLIGVPMKEYGRTSLLDVVPNRYGTSFHVKHER